MKGEDRKHLCIIVAALLESAILELEAGRAEYMASRKTNRLGHTMLTSKDVRSEGGGSIPTPAALLMKYRIHCRLPSHTDAPWKMPIADLSKHLSEHTLLCDEFAGGIPSARIADDQTEGLSGRDNLSRTIKILVSTATVYSPTLLRLSVAGSQQGYDQLLDRYIGNSRFTEYFN